jgi:TRAP-type C4-dicarboxylate transport system substrate-binding protein
MDTLLRIKLMLVTLVLVVAPLSAVDAMTLKIATISPDGTAWMIKMRAGAAEVKQRTNGRVQFKFYPGGIMGNDQSVLRKVHVGQLHGGAVASGSLAEVYPDSQIYGFPLLFRSLEEVDHVRRRFDPLIVKGLEEHGFVSFGLAEGGFAYIMCQRRLESVRDLKSSKVWIPSGDVISQTVFQVAGVSPIPLPVSDVLTSLQTGLIDTITTPPIVTIALQWHTRVKYLTDAPLSYVSALLIIDRKAFKQLTTDDQAVVREVMGRVFREIDAGNRRDNINAKEALRKQGIVFVTPDPAQLAEWQRIADTARAQLVAHGVYSKDILRALQNHLDAYRKSPTAAAGGNASSAVTTQK